MVTGRKSLSFRLTRNGDHQAEFSSADSDFLSWNPLHLMPGVSDFLRPKLKTVQDRAVVTDSVRKRRYHLCKTLPAGKVLMRIVYVLTSLGMGGAEKQALAVAERMQKRGHEVAILLLKPASAEDWPTSLRKTHLNMRRSPMGLTIALVRGRRFIGCFRPDLLHSHSFHANIFARLLKLLLPQLTVVSTIHNVYEGGWLRMLAYRLTDGLSRYTVAVSEAAAEQFKRLGVVPKQKCSVISNGIDLQEFICDGKRRALTRAAMGLSDASTSGEFVWIAVGRLAPAKNYPNLLRAFEILAHADRRSRVWIAGHGPDGAIEELEEECNEKGNSGGARWIGLRRDIPALLDAADGFVSGSSWEGMPLAIGEAMAMEKPVVATNVGGMRELIGDAGTLVPARDPGALAGAMLNTMRESEDRRIALGRAARERIVQNFSIESKASEWEKLYRQMMFR
jgi:glycosyltransferase involved in cell wall biosynthesis